MHLSHRFYPRCAMAIVALSAAAASHSQAACSYTIENEWASGFVASITLKNDTPHPVNGWSVSWNYANNRLASGWNAQLSGTQAISAQNLQWNAQIAPGQSVSFGVQGSKTGAAERPQLLGSLCSPAPVSSASSIRSSVASSASVVSSHADSSSAAPQVSLTLQEAQPGFCQVSGTIDSNHPGFTGSGFANTDNRSGAFTTWAVNASAANRYRISVRYANGASDARSAALIVNAGANGNFSLSLPPTGGWGSWQTITQEVDLERGNNTFELRATNDGGLANIDWLMVSGAALSAGTCPTVTVSSSSASVSSSSAAAAKFVGNITTAGAVRSDFTRYWNQITPENEGKWGSVEGSRDVYNWAPLDRIYAYARQHHIPVKAHTFVWGSQAPNWIANLSPSEQAAEIEEWIRDYCARYPDTAMIDVVNEATPGHAPAAFAKSAFGDNWIIKSFELARKYCPNAELILNDYNVLSWHTNEFIAMAQPAIAAGVVDALGLQAHGLEDRPFSDVQTKLNRIAALGLPIYISEYDIAKTDDQAQLRVMQQQFPLFYEHPAVKGVTLWGYVYGKTWVTGSGLIQDNGTPRPAMTWLTQYLNSQR